LRGGQPAAYSNSVTDRPSPRGSAGPISLDTARNAMERPDVRFHDLGHSIATWLTAAGTAVNLVQELLKRSGAPQYAIRSRRAGAG
jgi:integrase